MTISSKTKVLPLSPPVIDFSSPNLKPETPEWESVKVRVRKALEEYGCFEALFDGASVELRKSVFEIKLNAKTEKLYKGYEFHSSLPLYEGMGFNGVDNPKLVDDLTHKLWPQGNIPFSTKCDGENNNPGEFRARKYVEEHLNSATNHFHLMRYKALDDTTEEKLGLDPHIDRQLLSILCQNDVEDGLEIQTKDGEEWIKAKPSQASSFLVIAGASLHVLLNGEVVAALHRVVITGKKDRFVAGLFLRPKEGVIINAPDEKVDDDHPRLYKPFDFGAYLQFTYANTKKTDLSALKTYCAL